MHFCRRLPTFANIRYQILPVVVRCQGDSVIVTGVKIAAMLWTEFPEFRHKYGQLSLCV